ncbi:PREDICTED: interleukin-4 receptor subunit alpha [Elephantulus edwardii]|uniref:interleukin-4 receptor subunit alpha n=1 Tax=Elephantulus edwardii TaxID=28737 RepID=UPI0003F0A73A|nr:PREDICTED: interleukin-4 receptor subunit alpha [Elephantulus edwardii]
MGWFCGGLMVSVGYLVLMCVAGSGSIEVLLHEPTCLSDYIKTSTCEWSMTGPTNCSTGLLMSYLDNIYPFQIRTCIPENKNRSECVCTMLMDEGIVSMSNYTLRLWAGQQLLWEDIFIPFQHVKTKTPQNLVVHKNGSDMWLLKWDNPYTPADQLYSEVSYLVNISNEYDPSDFKVYNVTYLEPLLRLSARALKSGVLYKARVKAHCVNYNSIWSEWSHSCALNNNYDKTLEQRLPLVVSISCVIILAVCVSSYFIVLKLKKEWWDQIPNPAHSPLLTIIIQESQVSLWGERSRTQKPAKCPRWKTCLTKLLPCLLGHDKEWGEDPPKVSRPGPLQGPAKSARCPVELSKVVLWPESISVVRRVELVEAPATEEEEEEEVAGEKGSFCPSPEPSGVSFQEGREGIVARLTESLFLDLLGAQDIGESVLSLPSGNHSTQVPWVELPNPGSEEAAPQGKDVEAAPQGKDVEAASVAFPKMPITIADNPAYRSLGAVQSPSPGPEELDSGSQPASHLEEVNLQAPYAPQPSEQPTSCQPELETWEQILRQRVLQCGAAPAPASTPPSGYREFVSAMTLGSAQDSPPVGSSPSGEAGYKAFSSLLASSATCPGKPGGEASGGEGGYKPFQNLLPGCPAASAPVSVPLFTFGLDVEPPHSLQSSVPLSSSSEPLIVRPAVKGEDSHKPPLSPEPVMDPLVDDLGSGIVYSTLTCHLCGHLKQCHGQEERGEAHTVANSCCNCCCGDKASPPVSPLRAFQLGSCLPPASSALLGVSEGSKSSLAMRTSPSNAQSSGPPPKMPPVGSPETPCTRVP